MAASIAMVVVVVLLGVVTVSYNSLVRRRVRIKEAWAQIDVQLQRRHELIPDLVSTVTGYASHERATLLAVTAARNEAIAARASNDPAEVGGAETRLDSSLTHMLALAEGYPQLRTADAFLQLQEQLVATQDKIAYARHFYNTSVRDYNMAVSTVPGNLISAPFNFKPASYFEIDAEAKGNIEIDPVTFGAVAGQQGLPATDQAQQIVPEPAQIQPAPKEGHHV